MLTFLAVSAGKGREKKNPKGLEPPLTFLDEIVLFTRAHTHSLARTHTHNRTHTRVPAHTHMCVHSQIVNVVFFMHSSVSNGWKGDMLWVAAWLSK